MKKLIIKFGIFFIFGTMLYGEDIGRWERIKNLESQIEYTPNKATLNNIYKEYKREFNEYINSIKNDSEKIFSLGDYYFKNNRYDKALEVFSLDNTNIKNIFGSATCARFLNKNEEALNYYNLGISKNPNFYELYLGRGLVNRDMKRYNEAVNDFRVYLGNIGGVEGYIGLADTYMAMGMMKDAKSILEMGRSRFPESKIMADMIKIVYSKI